MPVDCFVLFFYFFLILFALAYSCLMEMQVNGFWSSFLSLEIVLIFFSSTVTLSLIIMQYRIRMLWAYQVHLGHAIIKTSLTIWLMPLLTPLLPLIKNVNDSNNNQIRSTVTKIWDFLSILRTFFMLPIATEMKKFHSKETFLTKSFYMVKVRFYQSICNQIVAKCWYICTFWLI